MDGGFSNKEMLRQLIQDMREVRTTLTKHTSSLDQIGIHSKETNGQVYKTKDELQRLEREMYDEDAKYFQKTIKYMIVTVLVGSLIWIKESRDTILSLLKVIL